MPDRPYNPRLTYSPAQRYGGQGAALQPVRPGTAAHDPRRSYGSEALIQRLRTGRRLRLEARTGRAYSTLKWGVTEPLAEFRHLFL